MRYSENLHQTQTRDQWIPVNQAPIYKEICDSNRSEVPNWKWNLQMFNSHLPVRVHPSRLQVSQERDLIMNWSRDYYPSVLLNLLSWRHWETFEPRDFSPEAEGGATEESAQRVRVWP